MTVAFEAEWSSDEADDGLSGDDGVKVDWVFKDEVSVGVGGKHVGGVTIPIFKVGRPFAVKREFRTVSNALGSSVFDSCEKYADNCVRNTIFFESWNWLDWNSDVVWSTVSFNWVHRRRVAKTIAMCKHLWNESAWCEWDWLAW